VTDDKHSPKAERKRLQGERAQHLSADAALIELADKIANVRNGAEFGIASPPWNPQTGFQPDIFVPCAG
jgi:hypothetical protein